VTDQQLPSGWFPDPLGRYDHRWFNGTSWTSDVSTDGRRLVDPLGISPGPSAPARNRPATVSVVCGLIGVAIAWIPIVVVAGFVLAVVAIVAGIRGVRSGRSSGVGTGRATAGLIIGIAALLASVVGVILSVVVFREVIDFVEPGPRFVDEVTCEVDGRDVTVTGTIQNLDDTAHSYTVFAEVDRRSGYDQVEDLAPSEVTEWRVQVRTAEPVEDCDPDIVVNGPFPFGLETDPYRE
jgi:hypothetical protein